MTPVLAAFGIDQSALIGSGGQSSVYTLPGRRILRVLREPADPAALARQAAFLADIRGALPFATPVIEEIAADGAYTIERHLPGRAMIDLLPSLSGRDRRAAFTAYADGAAAPGRMTMAERPYGQPIGMVTAVTWHDYLRRGLDSFIATNGAAIGGVLGDVTGLRAAALDLLSDIPKRPPKVLVHGDYFPGNVLLDDRLEISALIDFSVWTVVGDRFLDLAGAAIFLEVADGVTGEDVAFVRERLLARHGGDLARAGRFYRAYAAFGMADATNSGGRYPGLFPWAIANLSALRDGVLAF